MKWFTKIIEEKWSPWSKPCPSGCGDFSQVRFRLSDNLLERRKVFVNIAPHEMEAAYAELATKPPPGSQEDGR